jgi:hypothetical protein
MSNLPNFRPEATAAEVLSSILSPDSGPWTCSCSSQFNWGPICRMGTCGRPPDLSQSTLPSLPVDHLMMPATQVPSTPLSSHHSLDVLNMFTSPPGGTWAHSTVPGLSPLDIFAQAASGASPIKGHDRMLGEQAQENIAPKRLPFTSVESESMAQRATAAAMNVMQSTSMAQRVVILYQSCIQPSFIL